jgi:hypothetical protein
VLYSKIWRAVVKRDVLDFMAGAVGRLMSLGRPDEVPLKNARDLPQRDEAWECAIREARAWITPPDRRPYRPYIILTVSRTGKVVGTDLVEDEPTLPQVVNGLAKAMLYPAPGGGGKRRPAVVYVDDTSLVEALASKLKEIGVRCEFRSTLREAEQALHSVARFIEGEDSLPGLQKVPGVTPFMVRGLFEAAAFFYQETPWRWIEDTHPIEIHYPISGPPRYAVVMGHGGQTYGLAIYDSKDVLHETYAGTPPDQLIGRHTWTALLFGEEFEMPFDDLDSIETYDWPIAGPYAYPLLLQIGLSGRPSRPSKSELLRIEAALLAIPCFVQEYMEADVSLPQPAKGTLSVSMADGEDRISLIYPVPGFEIPSEDSLAPIAEEMGVYERNTELLDIFERWLREQRLSAKTIQKHLDNMNRFANGYLADAGGALELPGPADEAVPEDIDDFLADWLLYEQDQRPLEAVKSHTASLKRFYLCLEEAGEMPVEDASAIRQLLQDDRVYYLEIARDFEEGRLID